MGALLGGAGRTHTAECVSFAHPDKLMDRVADAVLDAALKKSGSASFSEDGENPMTIEGTIRDDRLVLTGEICALEILEVEHIVRRVWEATCCRSGAELSIVNELACRLPSRQDRMLRGTLCDPGVVIGYATRETPDLLPLEFVLARRLWEQALACRDDGTLPWIHAALKTQVTLDSEGKVVSAGLVGHYNRGADLCSLGQEGEGECAGASADTALREHVFARVLGEYLGATEPIYTMQRTKTCPMRDTTTTGTTRRRSIMDSYGPRVPFGGDGCSGRDPADIARCGAYMARFIAREIVTSGRAHECLVRIAYRIGSNTPVMVSALTEEGRELGDWVQACFDLTPPAIVERFELRHPVGWSYYDTSAYGQYGYACYPWERDL